MKYSAAYRVVGICFGGCVGGFAVQRDLLGIAVALFGVIVCTLIADDLVGRGK